MLKNRVRGWTGVILILKHFRGQNCELISTQCDQLDPCHNGGRCEGGTEFYKCFCPFGFGGRNCDKSILLHFTYNY